MRRTLLAALLIIAPAVPAAAPPAPVPPPAAQATPPGPAQTADKPATPAAAKPGAQKKKGSEKTKYEGPTETDIRAAYAARIDLINAGTVRFLDPAAAAKLTIRLAKVDIVECNPVEDRKDIYVCSILVEAGLGGAGAEFKRAEIAMVKEKDAWRVQ